MTSLRATLILRIPSSLHQRLKQDARAADMSLNQYCRALLSRRPTDSFAEEAPVTLTLGGGRSGWPASLQDLAAAVLETWGGSVEGLVLFGSFARGMQTANSDIDLLVVLDQSVTLDRDLYSHWRPHRFEGREVAPLLVQIPGKGERIGGLWFEVALDGIVLFDRDLHLSRFFSHVRELVADGRVSRMLTHGHPYGVYHDKAGRDLTSEGGS
jgi:predicted nucleotidyltransferase